jgi:hypothetical protein
MKLAIFITTIIASISALTHNAHAEDRIQEYQGEVRHCAVYRPWSDPYPPEVEQPSNEAAVEDLLRRAREDIHFYACEQITPYTYDYPNRFSGRMQFCRITQVKALFKCRPAW